MSYYEVCMDRLDLIVDCLDSVGVSFLSKVDFFASYSVFVDLGARIFRVY